LNFDATRHQQTPIKEYEDDEFEQSSKNKRSKYSAASKTDSNAGIIEEAHNYDSHLSNSKDLSRPLEDSRGSSSKRNKFGNDYDNSDREKMFNKSGGSTSGSQVLGGL
jgi:hypothetical protein